MVARSGCSLLCPYLGLEGDRSAKSGELGPRNRCYLSARGLRIDLAHQARFCLTADYGTCPWLSISASEQGGWRHNVGSRFHAKLVALTTTLARITPSQPSGAEPSLVADIPGLAPADGPVGTASRALSGDELGQIEQAGMPRAALADSVQEKGENLAAVLTLGAENAEASSLVEQERCEEVSPPQARATLLTASEPEPGLPAASTAKASATMTLLTWQCDICLNSNPSLWLVCRTCGNPSPEVEGQMNDNNSALLKEGLEAMRLGDEEAAHERFAAASEAHPEELLAWYWRAKTADTVDEVVSSLERALIIEPHHDKISADLAWARERLARKQAQEEKPPVAPAQPLAVAQPPAVGQRVGYWLLGMAPPLAASAAFALFLFWLSPLIITHLAWLTPVDTVQQYAPTLALPSLVVMSGWARLPSFDVAPAVPYALATLSLYAAFQLGERRPQARFWALAASALGAALTLFYMDSALALKIGLGLAAIVTSTVLAGWREFSGERE
jgi:hypothetical protein